MKARKRAGTESGRIDSASKKAKSAPPPPPRSCQACYNSRDASHFHGPFECSHGADWCDHCVRRLFRQCMNEGAALRIRCFNYGCQRRLTVADVARCGLAEAEVEQYRALIEEHETMQRHGAVHCPTPGCLHAFVPTELAALRRTSPRGAAPARHQCPDCRQPYCVRCLKRHGPAQRDCASAVLDSSLKKVKSLAPRQCPTCKVRIEKDGGCRMIRCTRCNTNFCWQCGGTFQSHTGACLCPVHLH